MKSCFPFGYNNCQEQSGKKKDLFIVVWQIALIPKHRDLDPTGKVKKKYD